MVEEHPWHRHRVYEEGPEEDPTAPGLWCVLCGQYVGDLEGTPELEVHV